MSPLWNKYENKQLITILRRPSLKRHSDYHIFAQKYPPLNNSFCCAIKGISLFISRVGRIEASMSVEAAIVLPLFLFFFLNLSCAIELIRLHDNLQFALTDVGNRMAVYGHILTDKGQMSEEKNELSEELRDVVISYAYVRSEIIKYMGKSYLEEAPLADGVSGIQLWESELLDERDCIDLVVTYEAKPLSMLVGFAGFRMSNRYYGHVWNGYGFFEEKSPEEYVYVAENGVVYHEEKDCTHLYLSVRRVSMQEAFESRNANGGRYTLCQRCGENASPRLVYITEEGDNIHYREKCPGLKRTVYTLSREQAKGYEACGRCAQN